MFTYPCAPGARSQRPFRSRKLVFERLEERHFMSADPILDWNEIALEAVANDATLLDQPGPTKTSRALAIVHAAMYDAVNAIDRSFTPYVFKGKALAGTNLKAAVAQAAHDTLVALYADQQGFFDTELDAYLDAITDGSAENKGVALGTAVAKAILADRQNDGSEIEGVYVPTNRPGTHQVDPLHPDQPFLHPAWGDVDPFAIRSGSQLRAAPPPALTSLQYALAFNEVKLLGEKDSAFRTPEQTEIGIFWGYDGAAGLGTPPRLYNQIVRVIAEQEGNSVVENARLFALTNIAMADAGIASWETKWHYDFWRPVVAIREDVESSRRGGADRNIFTTGDADWQPLGAPASNGDGTGSGDFTPPFPAYTSGHATFGAAAFQTLTRFYGTNNIEFEFTSDEFNGVTTDSEGNVRPIATREFESFSEASWENAISRIYLGIHWRFDATQGIKQGNSVANYVFSHVLRPVGRDRFGINQAIASAATSSANLKADALLLDATEELSKSGAVKNISSGASLHSATSASAERLAAAFSSHGSGSSSSASAAILDGVGTLMALRSRIAADDLISQITFLAPTTGKSRIYR